MSRPAIDAVRLLGVRDAALAAGALVGGGALVFCALGAWGLRQSAASPA